MKLEQQVCSIELAKRLKELGVKQESFCWWHKDRLGSYELTQYTPSTNARKTDEFYSAFTVAELGDMELLKKFQCYTKFVNSSPDMRWICIPHIGYEHQYGDTEADARAKMLIYLLEEKFITPPNNQ